MIYHVKVVFFLNNNTKILSSGSIICQNLSTFGNSGVMVGDGTFANATIYSSGAASFTSLNVNSSYTVALNILFSVYKHNRSLFSTPKRTKNLIAEHKLKVAD